MDNIIAKDYSAARPGVVVNLMELQVPMDYFDRSGDPVAYSEDDDHIYLFSGEAVAYLVSGAVYSYRGEQLGWCDSGWIRDKNGRCIAFSESATNGPVHPRVKPKPAKAVRHMRPPEEPRDARALRPIHSNAWSALTALDFFTRRPHRWPGGMGSGDGR